MAVDQVRHLNLFREMLSTCNTANNNQINMQNNLYSNTSNLTNSIGPAGVNFPTMVNDSDMLPVYNLNDVVLQSLIGKVPPPAVKDDSGVTFNNSFVTPVSRKRQREPVVLPAPMMSSGVLPSLPTGNQINGVNSVVRKDSAGFSLLGEDISLQVMEDSLELDRLVSQHMERMRMEIEERKKQQLRSILATIDESLAKKLREKDEEIDKIGRINWALQERVKSLCLENQIWRDLAQTNEAAANTLRMNLEQALHQVRENVNTAGDLTDDAVSCCGSSGYSGEEAKEVDCEADLRWHKRRNVGGGGGEGKLGIHWGENEVDKRLCKKCGEGESSVLLLPCRHMCLCTACGPSTNSCPLCNSVKNASVHVNLS